MVVLSTAPTGAGIAQIQQRLDLDPLPHPARHTWRLHLVSPVGPDVHAAKRRPEEHAQRTGT
jgi:hypothetical protein